MFSLDLVLCDDKTNDWRPHSYAKERATAVAVAR